MHRLIVSSDAYRRSCDAAVDADPDNTHVARFERRRLSAEELRTPCWSRPAALTSAPGGRTRSPPKAPAHFTQHGVLGDLPERPAGRYIR